MKNVWMESQPSKHLNQVWRAEDRLEYPVGSLALNFYR